MASEKELEMGKKIYGDLCQALDNHEWRYTRHDEDLTITMGMTGDDLPIEMIIRINDKAQVVSVYSVLPVTVPEDKRVLMATAVCVANNNLVNGSFDLDVSKGRMVWRLCTTYRGSLLGSDAYQYMVMVSASTVDKYNDRFLMLAKGMIDLPKFIDMENE